jgi:hypothetical protein
MTPANLQVVTTELDEILRLRKGLVHERDKTDDNQEQARLSSLIRDINENRLPNLRDRIRAAFNDPRGSTKYQLLELIRRVDGALNGIGTFRDLDVSEARLNLLRKQQLSVRSHREAKQIANEIRAIERALSLPKKQQRALEKEQSRREEMESEIRRLDAILYNQQLEED